MPLNESETGEVEFDIVSAVEYAVDLEARIILFDYYIPTTVCTIVLKIDDTYIYIDIYMKFLFID